MLILDLKEFLKSGKLGPLSLGIDRTVLKRTLGPPDAVGGQSRRHPNPQIWKYGDIEFSFDRTSQVLVLIHIDGFSGTDGVPKGAESTRLEPWIIRKALARSTAEQELRAADVDFTTIPQLHFGQHLLRLRSGVVLGFLNNTDAFSGPAGLIFAYQSN